MMGLPFAAIMSQARGIRYEAECSCAQCSVAPRTNTVTLLACSGPANRCGYIGACGRSEQTTLAR